jgi:hypothetical protein
LRDRIPDLEYVFCDTGEELRETYDYLDRLQDHLGDEAEIRRLKNMRYGFKDLLEARNGFLPSPQARWCTQHLKIKPFEEYMGNDPAIIYIALRADETHRKGYISTRSNIQPCYPFIEEGIDHDGVMGIVGRSGLGLPGYYEWRSRSGCYFCFFQQKIEWVGLLERHPDLYWKAASLEKEDKATGKPYTWTGRESLVELARPDRVAKIKEQAVRQAVERRRSNLNLLRVFSEEEGQQDSEQACLICRL